MEAHDFQQKQENRNEESQKSETKGCGCFLIVFLIIIAFLCLSLFMPVSACNVLSCISTNSSHSPKLFTRAARTSDIEFDSEYNFPISVNIILRPNYDIDNLELTIRYYDSNKTVFKTATKTVGSVSKGVEYKIQVRLTDFSFTEIWKLNGCYYQVSGGTVSYFQ